MGVTLQSWANFGEVANEIVSSDLVYKKIIGMQMMIEGLAMGAFAMAL